MNKIHSFYLKIYSLSRRVVYRDAVHNIWGCLLTRGILSLYLLAVFCTQSLHPLPILTLFW